MSPSTSSHAARSSDSKSSGSSHRRPGSTRICSSVARPASSAKLTTLCARYPTRERLAWLLMLVLYRTGRQAEALETFERTRTHLANELGLEPGPRLTSLQSQILGHDPAIAPSGATFASHERLLPDGEVTLLVTATSCVPPIALDADGRAVERTLHATLGRIWVRCSALRVAERDGGQVVAFASPATRSTPRSRRVARSTRSGGPPELRCTCGPASTRVGSRSPRRATRVPTSNVPHPSPTPRTTDRSSSQRPPPRSPATAGCSTSAPTALAVRPRRSASSARAEGRTTPEHAPRPGARPAQHPRRADRP